MHSKSHKAHFYWFTYKIRINWLETRIDKSEEKLKNYLGTNQM